MTFIKNNILKLNDKRTLVHICQTLELYYTKLSKNSISKYLKWLKQKVTGNLSNIHLCPECHGEGWYPAGMNRNGQVKEDCVWCGGSGKRSSI